MAAAQEHQASRDEKAVVDEEQSMQLSNPVGGARIAARYCDKRAGSLCYARIAIGDTQRKMSLLGTLAEIYNGVVLTQEIHTQD